jgi:hypothetical protein
VKLGRIASDTCVMLSKAYGGEAVKELKVFLNDINSSSGS